MYLGYVSKFVRIQFTEIFREKGTYFPKRKFTLLSLPMEVSGRVGYTHYSKYTLSIRLYNRVPSLIYYKRPHSDTPKLSVETVNDQQTKTLVRNRRNTKWKIQKYKHHYHGQSVTTPLLTYSITYTDRVRSVNYT